jgi:hypothetical protein
VFNAQYLQGLCQSRLSTADYGLLLVAFATTAVLAFFTRLHCECSTRININFVNTLTILYFVYFYFFILFLWKTLNVSDISWILTIVKISNCWLRNNTEYRIHINMYTTHNVHTKIDNPNPNGSLFIAIKSKAKYKFHEAAFFFRAFHKKTSQETLYIFYISVNPHDFIKLYLVALVSFAPEKLVRRSCWC